MDGTRRSRVGVGDPEGTEGRDQRHDGSSLIGSEEGSLTPEESRVRFNSSRIVPRTLTGPVQKGHLTYYDSRPDTGLLRNIRVRPESEQLQSCRGVCKSSGRDWGDRRDQDLSRDRPGDKEIRVRKVSKTKKSDTHRQFRRDWS